MSDRTIRSVGIDTRGVSPIEQIARAELARSARAREVRPTSDQPELVPPSGLNRPQGLSAVIDDALGPVNLPTLFELRSALGSVEEHLKTSIGDDDEMAALFDVVVAVLAEEQLKISNYIDVRDL